jgi:hypothetical protein
VNYKNGVAKKLSLFASFSLVLSINQALGESWPEKTYNPKPDADDVILPMPCDGSMVFRRVEVPVAGPLDDMSIHLGQDGGDWGFIEHTHSAFISGSFTQPKEKTRYYLIAKYEMSSLQYQAIMNDSCPNPSRKLSIPITGISWFDAVNAADKYNIWLRKNAEKEIPKEDGKSGFLRLPTEIEWEFAARGGLKVNSAEFRDLRYPISELKEYEWFSGSQSANGRLQLVGLLKSNPLGLYDILGNADEMVFDPFYLNKLDRFHGQAGGYIVRGGNYLTEESAIRSAARKEVNYYDDDHQFTSKTTGMRLALVSPTMTSTSRVKAIEASWNNLGSSKVDAAEKVTKDTAKELGSLASDVSDSKLKNKLKDLESQLRASNQKQQEEREQSIRASLNLGAFLCTKLQDDGKFLDFLKSNYKLLCSDNNDKSCSARKLKLDEQEDRLHQITSYYASSLVDSASLYGEVAIEKEVGVFGQMITINKKLSPLNPFLATHWDNQKSYMQDGKVNINGWLQNCMTVASKNIKQ